jgi:hypothetical protein
MRHPFARLAVSFALLLGSAAWSGCSSAQPDPDASRATASKFLDEVRAGRAEAAWEGTSAEFKSLLGRESFVGLVRKTPVLREKEPAEFVSFNAAERNGLPVAECIFRTASKKSALKVLLARENGTWKVERLTVD